MIGLDSELHNLTKDLARSLAKLKIFQYRRSRFVWLLARMLGQLLLLPFPSLVIVPTPYGKFATQKSTARVLSTMMDMLESQVQYSFVENAAGARVFVDVGASYGWYSLKASRIMRAPEAIISIEPDKNAYRVLLYNIQLNKLGHVVPMRLALRDEEGLSKGGDIDVKHTTLDSLMLKCPSINRVDLIKIDVEGMALKVLRGAQRTLSRTRPALLIELHGHEEDGVIPYLKELGYRHSFVKGFGIVACK